MEPFGGGGGEIREDDRVSYGHVEEMGPGGGLVGSIDCVVQVLLSDADADGEDGAVKEGGEE